MANRNNEMDMCTGPLLKKMFIYAIPVIVSSVLQMVYNAADMVIIGRFGGTNSLASVGATTQLISLLVNFFNGLSVGVSVVVAREYGAGNVRNVSRTVHNAIALSILSGAIIATVGFTLSSQMLEWMDTPIEALEGAKTYLKIYFIGIPAMMIFNFAAAVLRAVGDTRRPMNFLIVSGALNVALNLLFVIVFKMDVAGVAWATTISQYLSVTLILITLVRAENCVHLDVQNIRLHKDVAGEILRIGIPSGIQSSMFAISNVMIQSNINSFGPAAIAGNSAAGSIEGFVGLGTGALYQVNLAFAGQNMGARKYDRVDSVLRISMLLSLIVWGMAGVVYLLRIPLLHIYTIDPAVIEVGSLKLAILMAGYFFGGTMNALVGSLRGIGYVMLPMINSILGVCVFRVIWIYTFFAWYPTLSCLLISYPVSWALVSLAHIITYLYLRKKIRRERPAEA